MIDHLVLATAGIYTAWTGSKYFSIRHKQAVISAVTKTANAIADASAQFIESNMHHDAIISFTHGGNELGHWTKSLNTESFSKFIKETIDSPQINKLPHKIITYFDEAMCAIKNFGNDLSVIASAFPLVGIDAFNEAVTTAESKIDWNALKAIDNFADLKDLPFYSANFAVGAIVTAFDAIVIATGHTPIDNLFASGSASEQLAELSGVDNIDREDI